MEAISQADYLLSRGIRIRLIIDWETNRELGYSYVDLYTNDELGREYFDNRLMMSEMDSVVNLTP